MKGKRTAPPPIEALPTAFGSSKTRVDTLLTKTGHQHGSEVEDNGSTKLSSTQKMSSTNDIVMDGTTTERRLRRRRKQIHDSSETQQKRARWMIEHAEGLLGFPSRPAHKVTGRKGKSHTVGKEKEVYQVAKFSPQPSKKDSCAVDVVQNLALDKGPSAKVQETSEIKSAPTEICITGAFSLADLRTKSDSENFVQMLKNSVEPRKSGKHHHLRVEDKDREIKELKQKLVQLTKRNMELEMTAMNLHRLLSEILSCQGKKGMEETMKQKTNQQRKEETVQSAQDLLATDVRRPEGKQETTADSLIDKNGREIVLMPLKPHQQVLDGTHAIVRATSKEIQQQEQGIPSQNSSNKDQLIPKLVQQKEPIQNVAVTENRLQQQNAWFSKVTRWILPRNGASFVPHSSCGRKDESGSKSEIVTVQTEGNKEHGNPKVLITAIGESKIQSEGNHNVISTQVFSSLQTSAETTNTKREEHVRYMPITQPPSAEIGPPPPSYEVALTVYPPSQPWQHLQHTSQPLQNEALSRMSLQDVPIDHQRLLIGSHRPEFSQTTVDTSIPLFAFPQNHPALSKHSKLHMPSTQLSSNESSGVAYIRILPKRVSELSNGVNSAKNLPANEMQIPQKPGDITPEKSHELKTETRAYKIARQTSTDQVLQSAAGLSVKLTTAVLLEQNLKHSLNGEQVSTLLRTSSNSRSEDFKENLSAATRVPIIQAEIAPTAPQELVVSSRTQQETLPKENRKSSDPTSGLSSHKAQYGDIQYPVTAISRCNLKTSPDLKPSPSTLVGDDVTRCKSPEFPPPTQLISKEFCKHYEHKRNSPTHLLSSVSVVQNRVQSSSLNTPAKQSMRTSTLACNADFDKWEEKKLSSVRESVDTFYSRNDNLTQRYSSQSTTAVVNRGIATTENTSCSGANIHSGRHDKNGCSSDSSEDIENRRGNSEDNNRRAREQNSSSDNSLLSPIKLNRVATRAENDQHKILDSVPLELQNDARQGRATVASSSETVKRRQTQNLIGEDEFEPEPEIKEVYSLRDGRLIPQVSLSVTTFPGGVVLSWDLPQGTNRELINTYEILGRQVRGSAEDSTPVWKRMGLVTALALPMACTLTHFKPGRKYCFAVRAVGIHNQRGPLSEINEVLIGSL